MKGPWLWTGSGCRGADFQARVVEWGNHGASEHENREEKLEAWGLGEGGIWERKMRR